MFQGYVVGTSAGYACSLDAGRQLQRFLFPCMSIRWKALPRHFPGCCAFWHLRVATTSISACPDLKSEEGGALGEDIDGNNTGTRDIQPLHQPAPTPAPTPPPAASNTSTNTGSASTGTRHHQHRHPSQPRTPTPASSNTSSNTGSRPQRRLQHQPQHRRRFSPDLNTGSNTSPNTSTVEGPGPCRA